ncbi:kinase-like domain-containing protein [Astrocystis sublimbata]|nr:kinase-like domain-containing protein [Astrocystis sublimbata]
MNSAKTNNGAEPDSVEPGAVESFSSDQADNKISNAENGEAEDDIQEYEWNPFDEYRGVEEISRYNKGGFHPIHINDVLNDRYEIWNKLGSGGFGTVWLCRDTQLQKWRAVKVMVADHLTDSIEPKIYDFLKQNASLEELDRNHIAVPLDSFWIDGPNGRHLCFVLQLYGSPVSAWRSSLNDLKPEATKASKRICKQIAHGLVFLHERGLCHGDLRPSNILMKLDQDALDKLDEDQMEELTGEGDLRYVLTASGGDPRPRGPEYSVAPLICDFAKKFMLEDIVVADFGESFFSSNPKKATGIPKAYAAPELLFNQPIGIEVDIWALACTIYELRTSRDHVIDADFGGNYKYEEVVEQITDLLGPLPDPYHKVWEDSGCKFEEVIQLSPSIDSTNIKMPTGCREILEVRLSSKRTQYPPGPRGDDPPVEYHYEESEVKDLADLLEKMLKYNPGDRLSARKVKAHRWFQANKVLATSNTRLRLYLLDILRKCVRR